MKIVGLLLAGGQSRRMGGGDKSLRMLGGISLLDRVIARLQPQVEAMVINANGDPARFAGFGLPVVADSVPDFAGPLAGVLAGLDWTAANRPDCELVASVATDAPFCRATLWLDWSGAPTRSAPISPARLPVGALTRCSGFGRCGCERIYGMP